MRRARSGIESVSDETAVKVLGDSHGKISMELAAEMGDPSRLMQFRMVGTPNQPFFSKGTFQAALGNTLKKYGLEDVKELEGVDMILPTSSIKGASKGNLPPGLHEINVHLANHKEGKDRSYTLRSVVEKFEGDPLAHALKLQSDKIEKLNKTFGDREKLFAKFVKSLEPEMMPDPENPDKEIKFDPERWRECGRANYIVARTDFESGHYQVLESPIFTSYMANLYASEARSAAELEFVKAKGAMIFCSYDLENDEICVPDLPEGEEVAAIRSPIIKLQDISLVKNRHIPDMYNDAGEKMKGAYICSPQMYDRIVNSTRNFVSAQTQALVDAGVDVSELNTLNVLNSEEFKGVNPTELEGEARAAFVEGMNVWGNAYNDLVVEHKVAAPQLEQIRQDTFAAILAADYDGDNIAVVPRSKMPEIYMGIANKIAESDDITEKLDKIKLVDESESLGSILARKADPFILGTTANLAENLQSYAVEARRLKDLGSRAQKAAYLRKVAPAFYFLLAQPTPAELAMAEKKKVVASFRDYTISSTGKSAISESVISRFDAAGLSKSLPYILNDGELDSAEVDAALDLWADLALDLNNEVSLQNQIAVDTPKSERRVDDAFISGIGNRLRYLNDGLKKSLDQNTTYLDGNAPVVRDATTNRAMFVEQVNQNLIPFGIEATSYDRIKGLFSEVKDTQIIQKSKSALDEYKRLYKLSVLYGNKSKLDSGPSLVFRHGDRDLEITNILSKGHTPDSIQEELKQTGTPLEIKLVESKSLSAAHRFDAFYQSKGQWKPLGTLCNASATLNNVKKGEVLTQISQTRFVTPQGAYHSEIYKKEAVKVADDFVATIPEAQRDTYAAAVYQSSVNSDSTGNVMSFMFHTFGSEMVEAVSELKLDSVRLNFLTNAKVGSGENTVVFDVDDDKPEKEAVYVVGEDGERTKLGLIDDKYFHPRLGTTATVQVASTPPSQGMFTLPSGDTFSIGAMAKAEAAGEIFVDDEIEIEIEQVADTYVPLLMLNGKSIGRLSRGSTEYLESQGDLEVGKELTLTLESSGVGMGRKTKCFTSGGDVFDVVNAQIFADKEFKDKAWNSTQNAYCWHAKTEG